MSALKNFCSSHAVHLVSLGFLSPVGRWMEKKMASEKDTFAKFADVSRPGRGARRPPRARTRASVAANRSWSMSGRERTRRGPGRTRSGDDTGPPPEGMRVRPKPGVEGGREDARREEIWRGSPGSRTRAPRDFPRRLAPKTSLSPSSTLQTTSDEKTFATSHRSCARWGREPIRARDGTSTATPIGVGAADRLLLDHSVTVRGENAPETDGIERSGPRKTCRGGAMASSAPGSREGVGSGAPRTDARAEINQQNKPSRGDWVRTVSRRRNVRLSTSLGGDGFVFVRLKVK